MLSISGTTVSVVEDNENYIKILEKEFAQSPEFRLTSVYKSSREAILNLPNDRPDLVVLDIGMPEMDGIACLKSLKPLLPDSKFLMYTVFEDEENLIRAIRLGAKGYIMKDSSPELFMASLKVILLGGSMITPKIASKIIDEFVPEIHETDDKSSKLSPREKEILDYVSLGFKYSDIAEELDISHHTVARHIEKIYSKLEVNSKAEAIMKARRMGILKFPKIEI
jgi:two-component system NarL family response regulator